MRGEENFGPTILAPGAEGVSGGVPDDPRQERDEEEVIVEGG